MHLPRGPPRSEPQSPQRNPARKDTNNTKRPEPATESNWKRNKTAGNADLQVANIGTTWHVAPTCSEHLERNLAASTHKPSTYNNKQMLIANS